MAKALARVGGRGTALHHDIATTGFYWDSSKSQEWRRHELPRSKYNVALTGTVPKSIHVYDKATANAVLGKLEASGKMQIALDTEFDTDTDEMYTWQFSNGRMRVLVSPEASKYFKGLLASPTIKKWFHNGVADFKTFEKAGFELNGFAVDTMILDFLVNENRQRHGLKSCGADWLGIPMIEYKELFSVVPDGKKKAVLPHIRDIIANQWRKFLNYATLDPYVTYWLGVHHRTILKRLPATKGKTLWDYYEKHEAAFTVTLGNIMRRGVAVDKQVLKDIGTELKKTLVRSRHIFVSYAPEISVTRRRNGVPYVEVIKPENISMKSPQQLSTLFYDEMGCEPIPTGRKSDEDDAPGRSTNEEHLRRWAGEGNILADALLDHRRASTMRGTFIGEEGGKGLLAHVVREQGLRGPYDLVRTDLNQIGAVTMRLASRDPNLQNIPARKEKDPYRIRRAFIARDGCDLIVADYSLFELRLMAHFSRDKVMCQALREGRDLHSITAKKCFKLKCSEEAVKEEFPDFRNKAKNINFGLQYGMQAWLLAKHINVDVDKAQEYIDAYFDLYGGVYTWMTEIVEEARVKGYVQTILGRHRRVQHLNDDVDFDDKKGRARIKHAQNQAQNAPIQGSVADIIKIAMNSIENDEYLKDAEAKLLLQVHDELIVEAPKLVSYQVRDRVKFLMETAKKLIVPTPVDAHVAGNWNEAKG